MSKNYLNPDSSVIRYCKPRTIDENGNPTSASFRLREESKERYLSVNELGVIGGDIERKIAFLTDYYSQKIRKGKPLQSDSVLAELVVNNTIDYVFKASNDNRTLEFINFKKPDDPSYSGIYNIGYQLEISELIAQTVARKFKPRKN